jgi:anti-sigma factor RsiW
MSGRGDQMLTCQELVELVTDYIEGQLDEAASDRFEAHIAECPACTLYLEQMRKTIAALGRIPPESLSPQAEAEFLEAFRGWREHTT